MKMSTSDEVQTITKSISVKPSSEVHPLIDDGKLLQFGTTGPPQNMPEDNNVQKDTPFSPLLRQILGSLGPLAAIIGSGMTSGYSAILLPQLAHQNTTIVISQEESSWIASMAVISMALGCVVSAMIMERVGRRLCHQLLCVPFVLGWVLLSLSTNVIMLYVGRFVTGLCVGILTPLSTVYIAETTGPKYRGVILAVVSLGIALGILVAHLLGAVLRWQLVAAICAVFPFICYVLISMVPESPSWLAAKGRTKEAEDAFCWFRGYDGEATSEIQLLLKKYEDQRCEEKIANQDKIKVNEPRYRILTSSFVKPFVIMNIFFFVQQFSGINAVVFYTVTLLKDVGSGVDEYIATVIIDVTRVIMSVVACILLRHVGRRALTIVSGVGTTLCLLGLASFLKFYSTDGNPKLSWIPVLLFILYICSVSVGFVPLPWIMIGEVFPAASRGLGSGLSSCLGFLVFFAVVKSGPAMMAALGPDGTFFTYGTVALVGTVVLYVILPETKNRTLQQIEESYNSSARNPGAA